MKTIAKAIRTAALVIMMLVLVIAAMSAIMARIASVFVMFVISAPALMIAAIADFVADTDGHITSMFSAIAEGDIEKLKSEGKIVKSALEERKK